MISIVVPCLNEAAALPKFLEAVGAAMAGVDEDHEIIFVDDGSTDETPALLEKLSASNPRVRYLRLSRNFGAQEAILAGIHHSRGEAVVSIDVDLQHPPSVIPTMISAWKSGRPVVVTHKLKKPPLLSFRGLSTRILYAFLGRASHGRISFGQTEFRLVGGPALDALRRAHPAHPMLRSIIDDLGFDPARIGYVEQPRVEGRSKFGPRRSARVLMGALLAYPSALLAPVLMSSVAAMGGAAVVVGIAAVKGPAALNLSIHPFLLAGALLAAGAALFALWIIGELLALIRRQTTGIPLYVVSDMDQRTRETAS